MNNNIKKLIEQYIENYIDEATLIKNNLTDKVGIYKDLLEQLQQPLLKVTKQHLP